MAAQIKKIMHVGGGTKMFNYFLNYTHLQKNLYQYVMIVIVVSCDNIVRLF